MKLLKNERLVLRALEPEDLETLYKWENDTSLWENGTTTAPYSKFTLYEYLKNYTADIYRDKQLRLMITLNNIGVGTIDLFEFDPFHSRAGIGILIDKNYRRDKIATESLNLLANYAFGFLHLHQLFAFVPQKNEGSYKLFTNSGYKTCGELNDWLRTENGFQSVRVMQLMTPK